MDSCFCRTDGESVSIVGERYSEFEVYSCICACALDGDAAGSVPLDARSFEG